MASDNIQETARTTPSSQQTARTSRDEVQPTVQPRLKWDDTSMRSSYANVCNVASTREEVVLLFGINQAWNATQQEVTIHLSERVILSPFAAKRLSLLLANVLQAYESRFGQLNIEVRRQSEPAAQ